MKNKKRILIGVGGVLLVFVVYSLFFGAQTLCILGVRCFLNEPILDVVPEPMPLTSWSDPVSTVTAFDYQFSVPWKGFSKQEASSDTIVWWANADAGISVYCLPPKSDVFESILRASTTRNEKAVQMFVEELSLSAVATTNHYLTSKMLNTTPADLSVFDSSSAVMTKAVLLIPKALGAYGGSGAMAMYSFVGPRLRGFQMGDPSETRFVNFSLFDAADREVRLIVGIDSDASCPVTQDDLNTLIKTFAVAP